MSDPVPPQSPLGLNGSGSSGSLPGSASNRPSSGRRKPLVNPNLAAYNAPPRINTDDNNSSGTPTPSQRTNSDLGIGAPMPFNPQATKPAEGANNNNLADSGKAKSATALEASLNDSVSSPRVATDIPPPVNPNQHYMGGTAYLEKICRLPGGAAGNICIIKYYPRPDDPKPEFRVMKEIENSKTVKMRREKKHFLRDPSHPNITKYLYCGRAVEKQRETHSQFQMELMDLGSLRRVLLKTGNSTSGQKLAAVDRLLLAINVGYQILAGLDYFHHYWNGMHRDVKPENILVNSEGKVRLCDFDTSIDESLSGHTMTGTVMYLAPEVIVGTQNQQKYERQCDMWMFGMVLHEVAVGAIPFHGMSVQDLLAQPDFDFSINYTNLRNTVKTAYEEALAKEQRYLNLAPPAELKDEKEKAKWISRKDARLKLYTDLRKAAEHLEPLLRLALVKDPTQRGTTCQALLHPFFESVRSSEKMYKKLTQGIEAELQQVGVNLTGTCQEMMESWKSVVDKATEAENKAREAGRKELAPHEYPYTPTKHIASKKALNKYMKDVIYYRQKISIDRLAEWISGRRADLKHLLDEL